MILFLTTTCKERVAAMCMTISGVMQELARQKQTAHFVLAYTDGHNPERELVWLRLLAHSLGYTINGSWQSCTIHYEDCSGLSVASTKQLTSIAGIKWDTFVNLDDDLMVNRDAISRMVFQDQVLGNETEVVTYGCWDPVNARGYTDWNATRYYDIPHFLSDGQELKHAKVHLFDKKFIVTDYKWISQLYQLPRVVWESETVWEPILKAFEQPGVRGYDILLEQQLVLNNIPIDFYAGCESLHFGLEESYLGSKWKAANEIVKNNVTLIGDQ